MVAGMVMPLRELRVIYELLFRDGVMVAKKDKRPQTKHPEIPGIGNLQVIRAMVSLTSRGYVKETFTWRHFYWYLSNEGIVYLRDYLHLPAEIVPASLQRVKRSGTTLAVPRRAAHVQTVDGPTSYVPKPGGRPGSESREAQAERQGYRHKMTGEEGEEGYNDRTPQFRGRPPAAAEPGRPRASWETKDQHQHLYMKGRGFSDGAAITGEDRVKKSSVNASVSSPKPLITSQQSPVLEISVGNAHVVQAKQRDQPHTSPPGAVSEIVISKYSATETKKEKPKEELIQPREMKSSTPPLKKVKEEKTKVENAAPQPIMVAEVKAPIETKVVKEKPQKITNKPEPQAIPKPPEDLGTTSKSAISTHLTREVKREQRGAKVVQEPITPVEMTTTAERSVTRTSKVTITQDKSKPGAEKTINKPHVTRDPIKEEKRSTIEVAQKPDGFPAKSLAVNVLQQKVDTEITVEAPKSGAGTVSTTVVISSQMSTVIEPMESQEEIIEKSVKEDTKSVMVAEVPTPSEQHADLLKNDFSTQNQNDASVAVTDNVSEENMEVESSSKSKKKKKKSSREKAATIKAAASPDVKVSADKASDVTASLDVTQNPSKTPTLPPTVELAGPKNYENKLENKMSAKLEQEVPKPIVEQTVSKAVVDLPAVPPVVIPVTAQVTVKVAETSLKIPQGPLCPDDGVTGTELTVSHQETSKSETEIVTVTRMETVTVHKTVTMEQTLESVSCPVENTTAVLSQPQKVIDECEVKAPSAVSNAAEESSKGKKRGKAKKQAQARVSATDNTEPASPAAAEPLSSIDVPQATALTAAGSDLTDGSPAITPERMCSEEIRQATAGLTEAPTDKGGAESARLSVKKIKREVPKPKTSSSAREAPAAGESASAEPAVAAEATGAKAQASPCVGQETATGDSRLLSAAQAGKPSVEENRLSELQASPVQEDREKDVQEDTPSVTATPEATQPHLVDSCHSPQSSETDEANMRRKIVVVEEIIEVRQTAHPQAGDHPPPAPVRPEGEDEEDEGLDLDVLEEIAFERALLNAASPEEDDWDHSLEDPEEKTWPHFIEGTFASYLASDTTSCRRPRVLVMSWWVLGRPAFYGAWEVERWDIYTWLTGLPEPQMCVVFYSLY